MGVGDPASLIEAVNLGVDQFDCVLQTRLGRHGTALTSTGKLNMKNAQYALQDLPLDAECACMVCRRHSRAYIRHLFQTSEPTASRLVSYHNIAWTFALMAEMRESIGNGTFQQMRQRVMGVWGS
jgi:queuine tRNA-ribosyltransferase